MRGIQRLVIGAVVSTAMVLGTIWVLNRFGAGQKIVSTAFGG